MNEIPLMVRCVVAETAGADMVDTANYNAAFGLYKAQGLRVFAIFPPEFYVPGGAHGNPNDTLVGNTNAYIDGFAARAKVVADACKANVRDFIIWNEYTDAATSFDAAHLANNAKHFAALLYRCWSKIEEALGSDGFSLYWGGVRARLLTDLDVPVIEGQPGPEVQVLNLLKQHLEAVYDGFAALSPPITDKFWAGINIHIHHDRLELTEHGRIPDQRAWMGQLFTGVRALQAANVDSSEVMVGEYGETPREQCKPGGGRLENLFDAIANCSGAPDKMLYFSHHFFVVTDEQKRYLADWGLVNGNGLQAAEVVNGTVLYEPFITQLGRVTGRPPRKKLATQERECHGTATAAGVVVSLPSSAAFIGAHFYEPSADPAYSAGTGFSDVDSANLFVGFIPASSDVVVVASFLCELSADGSQATDLFLVNLRDAGGDVVGTQQVISRIVAGNQGATHRATCYWSITGLTAGRLYTYKLGFKKSDTHLTARIHAGDESAGGWGPIAILAHNA